MEWNIPGTVLTMPLEDADRVDGLFQSMCLAGGMVLSQVSRITGLEPYMVQNWVKRGFLAKPQQKRYTLRQLCRIININMLRSALPMEEICGLLAYVNGQLDDESDDLIDDSALYFMFVRLAARVQDPENRARWDEAMAEVLVSYEEPIPGGKKRVTRVLKIMLTAWMASRLCQEAKMDIKKLKEQTQ